MHSAIRILVQASAYVHMDTIANDEKKNGFYVKTIIICEK